MNPWIYMPKDNRNFSKERALGASDSATISGLLLPFRSNMDLYREHIGEVERFAGNNRTEAGQELEAFILGKYVGKLYGKEARNDFIVSRLWGENQYKDFHSWTEAPFPGDPRIKSHGDLLDLSGDTPVLIQAKNTGEYAANSRKRDPNKGYDREDMSENGIPLSVYYQEQIEMLCYGVPIAYVAVLIDGWDWKLYGPIRFNKEIAEDLIARYINLANCIDQRKPPKPQKWEDVCHLFPNYEPKTKQVITGEDAVKALQMRLDLAKLQQKQKEIEKSKSDIVTALGLYAGPHQYLYTSEGNEKICSVSEVAGRDSISPSDVEKGNPELYKQLDKEGFIKRGEKRRQMYVSGVAVGTVSLWTLLCFDGEKWSKSRKKYSPDEKKAAEGTLKFANIEFKWEKYS